MLMVGACNSVAIESRLPLGTKNQWIFKRPGSTFLTTIWASFNRNFFNSLRSVDSWVWSGCNVVRHRAWEVHYICTNSLEYLDWGLKWDDHINSVCSKLITDIYLGLSASILLSICLWWVCSNNHFVRAFRLQKR